MESLLSLACVDALLSPHQTALEWLIVGYFCLWPDKHDLLITFDTEA